ncbi:hypothetical protein S40288_09458 [Stachybotrys chartarum IBT 40288]|nr:hypothetical protein S40288_09458 [Stachybotrys chartarum IBT 40288]
MAFSPKRVPIPRRGVDYRGRVVLAPMVRAGELPSRLLALRYGADLVWGPETVDRALIGTERRHNSATKTVEWVKPKPGTDASTACDNVIFTTHPDLEENKLVFQIGTSDPERAVQAARLVAADVAGIDVNAGCPKPFSTSGGMGAALLREPDKLCAILEALVKEIVPEFEIGISVKIRILETPVETEALVRKLCATGITGLTVHCRTTPMRPRERAIRGQLRMIADICREAGVACLMNGDVVTKDEGLQLAKEFGADGAMIAIAAEKNPSCFRSASQGGPLPWRPVTEQYVQTCMDVRNRIQNTKYLLAQMVPGKEKAYRSLVQSKCYKDVCTALGWEHMVERAEELDSILKLDQRTAGRQKKEIKRKAETQDASSDGQAKRPKAATAPVPPPTISSEPVAQVEQPQAPVSLAT